MHLRSIATQITASIYPCLCTFIHTWNAF